MKNCFFLFSTLGLLVGCGGSREPASATGTENPATQAPSAAMPTLAPGNAGPAPSPAASPTAAPPPPAIDFAAANRPLDKSGNPISDLEVLNQAIMAYGGKGMSSAAVVKGNFKSPEEEAAAMSKQYESQNRTVKSLSDLVTAGVIKALPQAPPGKEYVFDPKTQRAALVDKK